MRVVGGREERRELHAFEILLEPVEPVLELRGQLRVGLVLQELIGRLQVAEGPLEPVVAVELIPQPREPLGERLAA
jgi:hypothetical protein